MVRARKWDSALSDEYGQLRLSPATDFKQFRPGERGLRILRHRFPRHSDFYPKTRIHKWLSKKCTPLSKKSKLSHSFNSERYVVNKRPIGDRMLAEQRIQT